MNCVMIILNYLDKERALDLAVRCSNFECINRVVIVDNCSPDDSYQFLLANKTDHIDVIQSERNGGFSYGNNFGVKYAISKYNPKYVLFANTDTIFPEENVISCINVLKANDDIGLVSTRMKNISGDEEVSCWKHKNYMQMILFCLKIYRKYTYQKFYYDFNDYDNISNLKIVDVVRGSFMVFKASVLTKSQYFDDKTFLYYEEDIISKRLQRIGYKVGVLSNIFYIHDHKYSEQSNKSHLLIKRKLDSSMYYYLCNYYSVSPLIKLLAKIIILYSTIEESIILKIKNIINV